MFGAAFSRVTVVLVKMLIIPHLCDALHGYGITKSKWFVHLENQFSEIVLDLSKLFTVRQQRSTDRIK